MTICTASVSLGRYFFLSGTRQNGTLRLIAFGSSTLSQENTAVLTDTGGVVCFKSLSFNPSKEPTAVLTNSEEEELEGRLLFQPLKGTNGRSDGNLEEIDMWGSKFQPLKGTNGRSDRYRDRLE